MSTLSRTQLKNLAEEIQSSQPPKEWDQIPELKKWKEQVALKNGDKKTMTFDEMVVKYKDLSAQEDRIAAQKKVLRESLQAGFLVGGEEKVICEGYALQMVHREGSRKIVPQKLLEQGVTAEQIARATEIGKASDYLDIREYKDPLK